MRTPIKVPAVVNYIGNLESGKYTLTGLTRDPRGVQLKANGQVTPAALAMIGNAPAALEILRDVDDFLHNLDGRPEADALRAKVRKVLSDSGVV